IALTAPSEARRLLEAGWRPLLALGLPLTVGTLAVADELVALLFGADFAGAAPLLRVLILGTLPLFWVNVAGHALIAADRVWPLVGVYALSALVNVAGNAVLIPRWGAGGAALATVVCEWLNLVLVVRLLRGAFGVTLSAAGLWRYAVATGAMLVVVSLARPLGLAVAITLAAATWPARRVAMDVLAGPGLGLVADGHALPLADKSVAAVLLMEVLEHVAEPTRLVRECARVLASGGHLCVTAPQYHITHHHPGDFFRYTRQGLEALCAAAGLRVVAAWATGGALLVVFHAIELNLPPKSRIGFVALTSRLFDWL